MSTRKVHEKKDKDGNIVEDGPARKRRKEPREFDGEDHTTTEEDSWDDKESWDESDSDVSEVYPDNSCVEQCLQPELHAPNLAYNADGTVNDKITQQPVHEDRPAEDIEPEQQPPVDFDIVDFPADELDAILDAAANPPIRPPLILNTPKVFSNPEDPFEVMFHKHLLPLCHTYDPREPGQIARGDKRYLNWKLEKHAYAHVVKLIKEEQCYVQEMDEYFLTHENTNLAMHSIYPGSINNGYELGRVYAYAEHHPGSSTDMSCRGNRWHTHAITINQARYHTTKAAWIPRLEPPKFRRVVFRQLLKSFSGHRHCAGCRVLGFTNLTSWKLRCPDCSTGLFFQPKRDIAALFNCVRYVVKRRIDGECQYKRIFGRGSAESIEKKCQRVRYPYKTPASASTMARTQARICKADVSTTVMRFKNTQ